MEEMVEFTKEASVLIHEGTFSDELVEKAHEYGHSTIEDAAHIAKRANVKRLFITHISPRYRDASKLLEDAKNIFEESHMPEDLEEVEITYNEA